MILSFSTTAKLARERGIPDPLLNNTKKVSRRVWSDRTAASWIKAWSEGRTIHKAWSASPYVKGAKQLGLIYLTCAPYPERLGDMPESDLVLEGGFWETTQDFINDIGRGDRDLIVYVVRWSLFQPC